MVGAGGFQTITPQSTGGNGIVVINPGNEGQKLITINNNTYWVDDTILLNFQPIENDTLISLGFHKLFLVVPYHPIGYKCTDITVGFENRIKSQKTIVGIAAWEKKVNGLLYEICPPQNFDGTIVGAYHMVCDYYLSEGSTIYLEVIYLKDVNAQPLFNILPINGLSATITMKLGKAGGYVPTTPPVTTASLIKGFFRDHDHAKANGVKVDELYALNNESLQGSEATIMICQ